MVITRKDALKRNSQGFTLVEVVISLLLLAFLLFSVGQVIASSRVHLKSSFHSTTAATIAQNMLETVRCMYWVDIVKDATFKGACGQVPHRGGSGAAYPPSPYPSLELYDLVPSVATGSMTAHVTRYLINVSSFYDPDMPGAADLQYVTVEVYWDESAAGGASRRRSVRAVTELLRRY